MASDIKRYAIILKEHVDNFPDDWYVKRTSDDLDTLRAVRQVGKTFRIVPRTDYAATRREGHMYTTLEGLKVLGAIYEMRERD